MRNINFSLFFKLNLLLTTGLFIIFLFHGQNYTFVSFTLTLLGLISSAVILYLIFYILLFIFSFSKKFILYISAILFIVTNIALIVDFFIYKLFHFHINAMVLNILTSPDAMDSIQIGIAPIIVFILVIAGLIFFEFYAINKIQHLPIENKKNLNSTINKMITIPLILIVLSEKISYGFASLFSKNEFISSFKVIPLYQPLTFRRIAAKHFGFNAKEQAKYSIKKKADLNYPLEPLHIDSNAGKFNIFILASDSVKYSILNEEVAPNIISFSKDALVFNHHYSGGNSTRFGIFSLIYGINATYWFSFLNANQKPVLFDVLQRLNYDISIISSTNTNWPEFRKTCYVNVQDGIEDEFEGSPWKKDEQSTACFLSHVDTYKNKNPLFNFIFLDAPHGYSYPESSNKYLAPKGEINYLAVSKESEELKTTIKRYKNAIYYNDQLFGKMIDKLKEKKLYDNSLIIYTSDHGQEFFEQGNFGHNTSFSKGQIHVPLMIKLPKSLQKSHLGEHINSYLTSHQDIVPSLLTLLGVKNDTSKYSNGKNFFSQTFKRDYIFSANWNNNAIVSKDITSVFSNLPNKMFNNEIRDSHTYELLKNKKINSKFILDTMNENKKFLK